MGKLLLGNREVCPVMVISKGTAPSGKYNLLDRIKDDNNNEIGTVSGFFTDANDVEYAVVCLDAQYRNASTQWCSDRNTVTNMPVYSSNYNLWWYDNAKETATQNTQLILDYCSAGSFTSTSCSHCRSQSFTIDGTVYYGQLPNMKEVFDMWRHRVQIEQMDTSASSHSSTNFSSARSIWSSSQYADRYGLVLSNIGPVGQYNKTNSYFACPVLELPNALQEKEMYIKEEMYRGKLTQILYPDEGYLLQHKITKLVYGAVSLEEGRKQNDYNEIKDEGE